MDIKNGLTSIGAQKLLDQYGLNQLPQAQTTTDWVIIFRQFKSPLIYILVLAAAVSFLLGDNTDALVIFLAVAVNTLLGFYQERKAERGLSALKQILAPQARVVRDGKISGIDARGIVPGDVVVINAGDRIPADGDLFEAHDLLVNESILTGESEAVTKYQISNIKYQIFNENRTNTEKKSTVFMGTTVVAGIGRLVVTGTGLNTEIGKIAKSLEITQKEETPLQKRLGKLAQTLTRLIAIAAVIIFITGVARGESLIEMFTTSVAVAVAAIPEGLVIALTTILALGMQRILKRKALARKLVVAETLGTVTVIATDKTGTLTEGKLKVVKTYFTDKKKAMDAATLANYLLDPLEIALWEWLTDQPKFDPDELVNKQEKIYQLPFDSIRKFSATAYKDAIYFIGAPEVLLKESKTETLKKQDYNKQIETWARDGLRVLGLAKRDKWEKRDKNEILKNVEFLGLVGFADSVRPGVKEALDLCRKAGIGVKVVTGDYRWTAEAVMRKIGININHPNRQILEGEELMHLSLVDLTKRIKEVLLFARVSPEQKLAIVEALKRQGEVVALLGDGVNDAPAIKRADIGIVVADATDVARETSDMVLLDSNFATIVASVEEGRAIFANIQKVMTYILSDTFAEVSLILLGLITGVPLPLTAAQILWINLVTDTFPTLALTLEPKEKHLLNHPPIPVTLPILGKSITAFMLVASISSGAVIFLVYLYLLKTTGNIEFARQIAFTAFGIKSLVYVFSLRERNRFLWKTRLFNNPWLWLGVGISLSVQLIGLYTPFFQKILVTKPLNISEWGIVIFSALLILGIIELAKLIRKLGFYPEK